MHFQAAGFNSRASSHVPLHISSFSCSFAGQTDSSNGLYGVCEDPKAAWSDWRSLGLTQLLKRASKRKGGATATASVPGAEASNGTQAANGAVSPKDRALGVSTPSAPAGSEFGLEALLRRTEALHLSSMEQV